MSDVNLEMFAATGTLEIRDKDGNLKHSAEITSLNVPISEKEKDEDED